MTDSPPARPSTEQAIRLHEALEERARHDDTLLVARSAFFAAIFSAIVAAEVFAAIYNLHWRLLGYTAVVAWAIIPPTGAAFSLLWGLVTERTVAGQARWRGMLRAVEEELNPYGGPVMWTVPPEMPGAGIELDVSKFIRAHHTDYHKKAKTSLPWYLKLTPNAVSRALPYGSAAAWVSIGIVSFVSSADVVPFLLVAPFGAVLVARLISASQRWISRAEPTSTSGQAGATTLTNPAVQAPTSSQSPSTLKPPDE